MKKLYQQIASALNAYQNCVKSGNDEWRDKHRDAIQYMVKNYMPSGSGIDTGTLFCMEEQSKTKDELIFSCSFHHMNSDGFYTGWTEHNIIVTPSLAFGFEIKVTGRNKNDIKDYLAEVYQTALSQEIADTNAYHAASYGAVDV